MYHRNISPDQNHGIASWEVQDAPARLAITTLVASDVGKICWQKDNDSLWVLKNHSPATWVELGSSVRPVHDFYNNGSSSGSVTIDASRAHIQAIQITANTSINIINWPTSGKLGELVIELVNGGAFSITWPTINWIKNDGTVTTSFNSSGVTLQASGTDFIILWTRNGGVTVFGKVIR